MINIERSDGRRAFICETSADLPDLSSARRLYLDAETDGLHPYSAVHKNRACGWAVTMDDEQCAWYVPTRHMNTKRNLSESAWRPWLKDLPTEAILVNASVKFDAHMAAVDGHLHTGPMEDVLVAAKLHNSDRWSHDLKGLGHDWLDRSPHEQERLLQHIDELKKHRRKAKGPPVTYADTPIDLCGEYACQDVFLARDLEAHLNHHRPAEMDNIWRTECLLTPVFFDMEREGMRADMTRVKVEKVHALRALIEMQERLAELTGREYADSAQCNFDIICNQLGLPVLAWNEKKLEDGTKTPGGPSFDKDVMARYMVHPEVLADERTKEVISLITKHRKVAHFKGLFLEVFLEQADENGVLHPNYNQVVRTGRTSCSKPNAQQMSYEAKELIIPPEGCGILSADASQIEFRIIIHYIQDAAAIAAYRDDPRTDFHQWVADQLDIDRKPAKNVNFATAYGAGQRKVTAMLASDPVAMEKVGAHVNALIESGKITARSRASEYQQKCRTIAERMYTNYHTRFSGIRTFANYAAEMCRKNGFVRNAFGRRRHLPARAAHKAFNAIVQGCAMDFIKTRMVAIAPRYSSWARDLGIRPSACVHDELTWHVELPAFGDVGQGILPELMRELESQPHPFRVPFTWEAGWSPCTWAEAASDDPRVADDGSWLAGRIPSATEAA